MNFFTKEFNTSHYWSMSRYNSDAYIDAFFSAAYGDCNAFSRACRVGIVFW